MDNTSYNFEANGINGITILETVRPSGIVVRIKKWFEEYEEERRTADFEVDPLLDFPRDF